MGDILTLQQAIKEQCEKYARDYPNCRFIGYNTVFGSRMYGTLSGIPTSQCIETPVAENLMVGLAIGMSMEGYRPVVCFERHDFMLLALDAIVNHMDKLAHISGGQFKLPIIIRAIVGGSKPIDPGPMHKQSYTLALMSMLKHTPVCLPMHAEELENSWNKVGESDSGAVVIVEHKDMYSMKV